MNIEWGSINNDLCKSDAVIMAHNFAHQIGDPVYAVETKWGWTCSKNKPSLRFGKVIECYEGKESIA